MTINITLICSNEKKHFWGILFRPSKRKELSWVQTRREKNREKHLESSLHSVSIPLWAPFKKKQLWERPSASLLTIERNLFKPFSLHPNFCVHSFSLSWNSYKYIHCTSALLRGFSDFWYFFSLYDSFLSGRGLHAGRG